MRCLKNKKSNFIFKKDYEDLNEKQKNIVIKYIKNFV